MKNLHFIILLFLFGSFLSKSENENHSYFATINNYNQLIKGDTSNLIDKKNLVTYIHKFHKEKEMYLSSCFDELYGANVSYYHHCEKFRDSNIYHFKKIYLNDKNRENNFLSFKNKIYLVEYKLDTKHLKLVSEYNNSKQIIWFKYIGNKRPDWICKN